MRYQHMRKASSLSSQVPATVWATLDYVRHGIVLTAWLLTLKAFAVACSRLR